MLAVAGFYKDWAGYGQGIGNYMSYGEFPQGNPTDPRTFYLPRGRIMGRDLATVEDVDQTSVAENVAHAWYTYSDGDGTPHHPWKGETNPHYTGPQPPFTSLAGVDKYTWLKAPRYEDQPMEVGPLARMLVAYASGQPDVKQAVDGVLSSLKCRRPPSSAPSGASPPAPSRPASWRTNSASWLTDLENNLKTGDLAIADVSLWDPSSWPAHAEGYGMEEAPRGSLGHWVVIDNQAITNYQLVVPSTWNGSPADPQGRRGAWEEALVGTPIADPARPVEILRTVHSFDPCLACAVHVYDPASGASTRIDVA